MAGNLINLLTLQNVDKFQSQLESGLSESSNEIIILCSSPALYIAQNLSSGISINSAIKNWQYLAKSTVDCFKKNSGRLKIILVDALPINESQKLPHAVQVELSKVESIDLLFLIIAKAAEQSASNIETEKKWLEACAVSRVNSNLQMNTEALQALVDDVEADKQAHQQTLAKNNDIQQENELLLLQLQQVQEELEATFIDKQSTQKELAEKSSLIEKLNASNSELKKSLQQRDSHVQTLEQELAAAQAEQAQQETKAQDAEVNEPAQDVEDLKEENELLLLQLQQVQEELEHYFIKCKELEAGGAIPASNPTYTSQPAIARPQATQSDVTDSPAWRVVAPFYTKLDKLIRHLIFKRQAKVVKKSKLFDKKWYAQTYQDVKGFKGGAALHYVAHGAAEGRDPGPEFSSERYWAMNPDVAEKGTNPLVHYELFGKNEGRYY